MSPLPRFLVCLTVGKELFIELHARDAQAAEDIALYLFAYDSERRFSAATPEVIDCTVTPTGEQRS